MATDGVTYRWYLGGVLTETTPGLSVELDGLATGVYSLTLTSVDDSGNESAPSSAVTITVGTVAASAAARRSMTGLGS